MRKIAVSSKTLCSVDVERLRRGEVAAEGLLHHDARTAGAAGAAEELHHRAEQARRYRQIEERPLRRRSSASRSAGEGFRLLVVAVHVAQQREQLLRCR